MEHFKHEPLARETGQPLLMLSTLNCIVLYCIVWYGMVWYGMVWYGMVWYGIVLYRTVLYCIIVPVTIGVGLRWRTSSTLDVRFILKNIVIVLYYRLIWFYQSTRQITFRKCMLFLCFSSREKEWYWLKKDLLKISKIIRSAQRLLFEGGHPSRY